VNGSAPAPLRPTPYEAALLPRPRVEHGWQLLSDEHTLRVVCSGRTLAEACVSEPDHRVVVEFWVDPAGLPAEAIAELVTQAFARPAMHPGRAVVVCVAKRDCGVLAHAERFVADTVVRPAGVTCLIEGRVRISTAERALCAAT
jgi:hypothetical protein